MKQIFPPCNPFEGGKLDCSFLGHLSHWCTRVANKMCAITTATTANLYLAQEMFAVMTSHYWI